MAKYITNPTILRDDTGKRYLSTVVPEPHTSKAIEYTYTSRLGDRWDTIAYKYLGQASLWYAVARANGGANGSIFIKPGTVIIIPELS